MNLYEQKMPGYLIMSRADLIAEITTHGDIYRAAIEHLASLSEDSDVEPMDDKAEEAMQIIEFANDVMKHRFGFTIHLEF